MAHDPDGWQEVSINDTHIRVSDTEPVAVITDRAGTELIASWPDLDVGLRSPSVTVAGAPSGAWVFYTSREDEQDTRPPSRPAAVHVSLDGAVAQFPDLGEVEFVGTTRHGLWLSVAAPFPDVDDENAWLEERALVVLAVDGTRSPLTIDRRPRSAFDDGGMSHLVVYASAPVAEHYRAGGIKYSYPYLQVTLPADELPAGIRVEDCSAEIPDDETLARALRNAAPRRHPASPGDPSVQWNLVDLAVAERKAAVDRMCAQFAHLDAFWHGEDGSIAPLVDGLHDPRVEVVGQWPGTRVEVSFRHPYFPQGRCRRTVRVFDDAGRVATVPYASIGLMEDLDTRALPPWQNAHDGVLEI